MKAAHLLILTGLLTAASFGKTLLSEQSVTDAVRHALVGIPSERFTEPQELIKIGDGRRLNLLCVGSGPTTVIFESGTGGGTYDWRFVQDAISKETMACSYDRAGYGFSDAADRPSDARNAVDDLHQLIIRAHLRRPVVLVGHSNGGIYSVLYAETYPQDVAGLLLVDPGFTAQQSFDLYGLSSAKAAELRQVNRDYVETAEHCAKLAHSDAFAEKDNSSSSCLDNPPNPDPQLHQALDKIQASPAYTDALHSEFVSTFQVNRGMTTNDREVPLRAGTLGDIPLFVLTASEHKAQPSDFTASDQAKYYAYWKQGHDRLAALSTRGRNIIIDHSGHFIQRDRPDEVIRYINRILEEVNERAKSSPK